MHCVKPHVGPCEMTCPTMTHSSSQLNLLSPHKLRENPAIYCPPWQVSFEQELYLSLTISTVEAIPDRLCLGRRFVETGPIHPTTGSLLTISPCEAHPSDIFTLAVTSKYLLSASGDSNVKLWDIASPDHPLVHSFTNAHSLGVHHVATSKDGKVAASAGFGGETSLWDLQEFKKIGNLGGMYLE